MRNPEMQTVMGKTCVSENIILFDTFAVFFSDCRRANSIVCSNSMLDGSWKTPAGITETKEIGACEVLRAQELTHTVSPQAGSNIQKREDNREGKKSGMH